MFHSLSGRAPVTNMLLSGARLRTDHKWSHENFVNIGFNTDDNTVVSFIRKH